jgi:hypothetical protein
MERTGIEPVTSDLQLPDFKARLGQIRSVNAKLRWLGEVESGYSGTRFGTRFWCPSAPVLTWSSWRQDGRAGRRLLRLRVVSCFGSSRSRTLGLVEAAPRCTSLLLRPSTRARIDRPEGRAGAGIGGAEVRRRAAFSDSRQRSVRDRSRAGREPDDTHRLRRRPQRRRHVDGLRALGKTTNLVKEM